MKLKIDWFWGCTGSLGILGYLLKEPLYYTFFAFFIFFLKPVIKKTKSKSTNPMKLSNDAKLGILTAICMLGGVVVFKNVLHIKPPFMASYGAAGIFILYIILKYSVEEFKGEPLYLGKSMAFYYGLTIIFVTLATIILYAFF